MLGPLDGRAFLDLCAGSGQMALEAFSRGASVTSCEPDPRRYRALKHVLGDWDVDARLQLLNIKAQMAISQLCQRQQRFFAVYVDPPYDAVMSGRPLFTSLVEQLGREGLLEEDGLLLVQHPARQPLDAVAGLTLERSREYGDTALSSFRCD